ncbi:hypothetical protein [Pimelobacter simplex]|uniref:hypothetical protein n=1 Tax=Nocardioides simplex TaxID=2045 RepID=UPI00193312F5|nr:hypothetical protein [Pimelobacter simplex]
MSSTSFGEALASHARQALAIAESSFDVRDLEPSFVAIVRLVQSHPEHRAEADQFLAGLVPKLCETPPPSGLSDLLEYCAHTLDLPALLAAARQQRSVSLDQLHRGESRRPWEHARRCEQVIEAADPNWEARDMYASLSD